VGSARFLANVQSLISNFEEWFVCVEVIYGEDWMN
jgi:hypothetical protein